MRRPTRAPARRSTLAAFTLAGAALLSVCTAGLGEPAPAGAAHSPTYYVSLGDSYSVGYQRGPGATPGYASYVAHHTNLTLVNFGCAGATTTTLLAQTGCLAVLPHTAGGVIYTKQTQIALATAFIALHKGHIGLITVTIGINDVVPCSSKPNPVACVTTALAGLKINMASIVSQLRAAAGPKVPIIGSTYPDVILGDYVYPTRPAPAVEKYVAKLSVTMFKTMLNPALAAAYAKYSGAFVDVTKATGAYTPLNRTVHTKAYGTIPVAVASVCTFTWFCAAKGNIHPMNKGYTLIGKLIVAKYDAIKKR